MLESLDDNSDYRWISSAQYANRIVPWNTATRVEVVSCHCRCCRIAPRPQRLDILQPLHAELVGIAPISRAARNTDGPALPFFESYFSNFIEGKEFAVDEAAVIVFEGHRTNARPEDAYDVLGTWKVTSDKTEMSLLPQSFEELKTILKDRRCQRNGRSPHERVGHFQGRLESSGHNCLRRTGTRREHTYKRARLIRTRCPVG